MGHSPFSWFHKHQKEMLFVLAVVLIVGWLIGPTLIGLFTEKQRVPQGQAMILGQPISSMEFNGFMFRWNSLFNGAFEPDVRDLPEEQAKLVRDAARRQAWAYLAAVKLANKMGIQIPDVEILPFKRHLFAQAIGAQSPEGVELKGAAYQYWLKHLRLKGPEVDETLRERIKAARVMAAILGGIEPTAVGALEGYLDGHRQYDLRYVELKDADSMQEVKEPTTEEVETFYDKHSARGGRYWKDEAFEVSYAGVSGSAISSRITITTAEIEDWYNKNKDEFYRKSVETPQGGEVKPPDSTPAPEMKYIPMEEVKTRIEESIRRQRTYEQANALMEKVLAAYRAIQGVPSLEAAVRQVNDPAVTYERTGALTLKELSELPGIGNAKAGEELFHSLVAEADREKQDVSPVLRASDQGIEGIYVFRMMKYHDAFAEPLEKVRDKVIADIKRIRSAEAARAKAVQMVAEMGKEGADFVKVAEAEKLQVKSTGFFRNSFVDANRPRFMVNGTLTADTKLVGPIRWDEDRGWVIAEVTGKKEAPTAGFQSELSMRLESDKSEKGSLLYRELLPEGLLRLAGFQAPAGDVGESVPVEPSGPLPSDDYLD